VNPAVRRAHAAGVIVFLIALVPFAAADSLAPRGREPTLALSSGMPHDLERVVRTTWGRFVSAFPARASCFEPVTVAGAWELGDRATYDPADREVTVRIPGTAPNLAAALVHEFAHHLEFTCRAQRAMRSSFIAVQGLPRDARWFEGSTWERIPSENFAEAVVEYVLGHRPSHSRIAVSSGALAVIGHWARHD
jgi:hypothetical protein